jgi:hypothetical protein
MQAEVAYPGKWIALGSLGGRPHSHYYLTLSCCEHLGMMSDREITHLTHEKRALSAYGRRCTETPVHGEQIPDTFTLTNKPPHCLDVDTAQAYSLAAALHLAYPKVSQ